MDIDSSGPGARVGTALPIAPGMVRGASAWLSPLTTRSCPRGGLSFMSRMLTLAATTNPVRTSVTLLLLLLVALPVAAAAGPPTGGLSSAEVPSEYGQLPLGFVANAGQTDSRAAFVAHGRGYTLFVSPTETVFVARPPAPAGQGLADRLRSGRGLEPGDHRGAVEAPRAVVHMRLLGADASAVMTGEERSTTVNYLIGSDRSRWRTGVPAYARVRSPGVYPGIDLVFYGSGRQFEYDFALAPGSDPRSIRLAFDGITETAGSPALEVDARGDLVLRTLGGDLRLRKPIAYQEVDGVRHPVAANFALRRAAASTTGAGLEVGIDVVAYDPSRPLVIDPIFDYSTYLGGSGHDAGMGIAVDANGSAYVAGYTESSDFPGATPGPTGPAPSGGTRKAFIAKLSPTGTSLIYATYLGGDGNDAATAIAVDPPCRTDPAVPCNVYVTGMTDSTNFPTVNAYQPNRGGGTDAFVTKLDPDGNLPVGPNVYSTYLGGSGTDVGLGIAVGFGAIDGISDAGQIYITGYTESDDCPAGSPPTCVPFPQRTRFQPRKGVADAFVTKVNPIVSGNPSLVYSSPLGGSGRDEGHAIAVDAQGQAHITGLTDSTDFPLVLKNLLDQPGTDAFVTKVRADGKVVLFSQYIGGNGTDVGLGIALGPDGSVYITGHTDSTDFPTKTPYQAALLGRTDAFVTQLNPTVGRAASLLYSTYLGGPGTPGDPESGADAGLGIAVGPDGHVYVTGYTESASFPTVSAAQGYGGGRDAFAVRLAIGAGGGSLIYSTYVGGSGSDEAYGIAVDGTGAAYITGLTQSGNFPTVPAHSTTLGGEQDAFVAKLNEIPSGPDRFRAVGHHLGLQRDGDRDDGECRESPHHRVHGHPLLSVHRLDPRRRRAAGLEDRAHSRGRSLQHRVHLVSCSRRHGAGKLFRHRRGRCDQRRHRGQ